MIDVTVLDNIAFAYRSSNEQIATSMSSLDDYDEPKSSDNDDLTEKLRDSSTAPRQVNYHEFPIFIPRSDFDKSITTINLHHSENISYNTTSLSTDRSCNQSVFAEQGPILDNSAFNDKIPINRSDKSSKNLFDTKDLVHQLPVKRIFDSKSNQLHEVPKLLKELQNDENLILLKVKLIGLDFKNDFNVFTLKSSITDSFVVPGSRIVGKIYDLENGIESSRKYLVYPYSTCYNQRADKFCINCQHIEHLSKLRLINDKKYFQYPCLNEWVYGYTIDGGMQDYLKVTNYSENLVELPFNVSTHDALFLLDISLPLYSYLKQEIMKAENTKIHEQKVLFIVPKVEEVINDLLLVLRCFSFSQKNITFMDPTKITKLRLLNCQDYEDMFDLVLVYDLSLISLEFARMSSKLLNRYYDNPIILFDQFNRIDLDSATFQDTMKRHFWSKFQLGHEHKRMADELFQILSDMNVVMIKDNAPPLNTTRSSSYSSTVSSVSHGMDFDHSDAFQGPSRDLKKHNTLPTDHYCWLHYDKEFNLVHSEARNGQYKSRESHSLKDLNYLITRRTELSRVSYINKTGKTLTNLNFVMC